MSKLYYVQCNPDDGGCDTKYPGDLDNCPKCGSCTTIAGVPAHLPIDGYVYDIETYPNIFTFACEHPATRSRWLFEISDRVNQRAELIRFLEQLATCDGKLIGFNNLYFDYPVIHFIISNPAVTVKDIYDKSQFVITSDDRWGNTVWESDHHVKQIDLLKIHHFDNRAKSTSLKALEFFMQMDDIQDLPFPVGTVLNDAQKDELIKYNWHDVKATVFFWVRTLDEIEFRNELTGRFGKDFTNLSNTKIGMTIFQTKLEENGIQCFNRVNGKRHPRQTIRPSVNLSECIPDYIRFERDEFNVILSTFKNTVLTGTNVKALFKDFNTTIDGLTYVFGAGGQHAGRPGLFEEDDIWAILDIDVEGMYPRVIGENGYYPEHLGQGFCPIFIGLIEDRIKIGKKTKLGMGLKESANATYGNLGMEYSFVYDLKTLLSTTLTGQLVLSMLVEQFIKIPDCTILQTNTDGFTVKIRRSHLDHAAELIKWWENISMLKMECNYYSRLWIKNVNSYIAEYTDGTLKLKKDYNYKIGYHQDPSALIVAKAAEAHMVRGVPIDEFIKSHTDKFDFCLRAKVPRADKLVMRWDDLGVEIPMQKITRYFVSNSGGRLVKISPPTGEPGTYKRKNKLTDKFYNSILNELPPRTWDERIHTKNKSTYEIRETGINVGQSVTECNNINKFDWSNINYEYYIKQTEKLVIK